jgi:SAM-dependent methyltransferase
MTKIPHEAIKWLYSYGADPTGHIFWYEGEVYRAIRHEAVQKVIHLFETGIVEKLINNKLLVDSKIADIQVPGYSLVLHHKRIPFITYPEEWTRSFLLDSAILTVKLNLELLEHNYATIDYHGHNIAQAEGGTPIWIDFGSIVPVTNVRVENMHREFCSWFLYLLILVANNTKLARLCRVLLQSGGIQETEFLSMMNRDIPVLSEDRETWLIAVYNWLKSIIFQKSKTFWSDYYEAADSIDRWRPTDTQFNVPNTRDNIVKGLLEEFRPETVIDLGCNSGKFSVLAARLGSRVCALDNDEGALEVFYQQLTALKEDLPITIAFHDIGDREQQRRSNLRADVVLALAITHHLRFGRNLPFSVIAFKISKYCRDVLITEYMPDGLGIGSPSPDPLPRNYTLAHLIKAFRPYFNEITTIEYPSGSSRRIFVVCKERSTVDEYVHHME